jgi:hypothetical protein
MDESTTVAKRTGKTRIDLEDQFLFFALFGIGAAAIWSLKLLGYSQWTVTAIPVSLMFLYAGMAFATRRYRLREDRVGDNIYYLGFLYTLTSLSYALYVYDPSGAGATEIITNFGIAILTTIIGLAGRVFFNQMRVEPAEFEREARFALVQASSELRASLADATIEMSNFKRKTFQILEEGVTDMSSTARATLESNIAKFSETNANILEQIQGAFRNFTDHSSRLNEIASRNVEALAALFERIERIEASPELLAAKLDPVMQRFAEVAEETVRRNRAQTNELKRFRDLIEATTAATDALQKSVGLAEHTIFSTVGEITKRLEENAATAGRFNESVGAMVTTVVSELNASREVVAALEAAAVTHKASFTQINAQIGAEVEAARKEYDLVAGAIEGSKAQIAADIETARKHRDLTAQMVEESGRAIQEIERSLVSLTRTIVERLGAN